MPAQLWTVTPAMARVWLSTTHNQGPPDWQLVAAIADDIEAGRWQPDRGDPVRLSPAGHLDRGWHRCLAVNRTGIAVPMWVENLPAALLACHLAGVPICA